MSILPETTMPTDSGGPASADPCWSDNLESLRSDLGREARRGLGGDLTARLDASDIVQETMLRAVRALSGFRGRTSRELRSWVRTILATSLTTARRHHRFAARRGVGREVSMESVPERIGPTETPSRLAIHEEQKAAMMLALLDLSERDRMVITLRYIQELSFVNIGQQLGITDEAARKLCGRALERLREVMRAKRPPT